MQEIIFSVVVPYLLGSIPCGLVLVRLSGMGDIRKIGSGNIGATNVMRTGKKGLAILTLLLDVIKGLIAVCIAQQFSPDSASVAALAAVLGHDFPIWLRFKGGKGVATSLGVIAMLEPVIALLLTVAWGVTFFFTRISSLSAITAALLAPLFAFFLAPPGNGLVILALGALLVWRHKENIRRLLHGEEGRFKK